MATCNEDCFCHVEAVRGLSADGLGSADNPFIITPDDGRTLGLTVVSAAGLPSLPDTEIGTLAFDRETGLTWHYSGGGFWRINSPTWAAVNDDSNFSVQGDGVHFTEGFIWNGLCHGLVWVKGWIDVLMPANSITQFRVALEDVGHVSVDTTYVTANSVDGGYFNLPFILMGQSQVLDGESHSYIVGHQWVKLTGSDPTDPKIRNLRMVSIRGNGADLTEHT